MRFCHLHVHTEYSLLDGAAQITKLIARVKELGMDSCAITDHGVMYGAAAFDAEARKNGIHPVIGCEVYVAPRTRFDKEYGIDNKTSHLILLAENQTGYRNLIKLVSAAHIDGLYYKPRIDKEILCGHSEGLIALSACLAGEIPKALVNGNYNEAKRIALEYMDMMGKDNYFLEIQDHGIAEQKRIIPEIIRLSEELGVGLVATNDVHYLTKEDAKYQDILMCVQMRKTVNDTDRMKFETEEFYVKSPEEMSALFEYVPQAVENTEKIAKRCNVEFDYNSRHLPSFDVPGGKDAFEYLKELCDKGLAERYNPVTPELRERLDYELGVIKSMGFVDYFLIVSDFIRFARENDVMVGPGRGSAAGSIVAYCLRITNIDPIRYTLIFERFLNPERISMPDIDIDFAPSGRQKVIEYVVEKYGAEQVAQIVTFGTMQAKQAIRDVGRTLDMPLADVNRIAKMVPDGVKVTIEQALKTNPELRAAYESDARTKELIDVSQKIEGFPRHAGTHAAGVVITSEPIVNYVPLQLNKDNFITTQYPKDTVESLGLLKMDFLGLRNLIVIENAVKIIEKTRGVKIDINDLDYDRPEVYRLIASGNTDGVFQLESAGMQSFMKELRPSKLEDVIAGIALYRPGPMEQIPRYLHNKAHPEDVTYLHPLLKDILDETYGCMVYQEQVLEIVRVLAGYSLGKADSMRRVISKKKEKEMEIERKNFIYGNGSDIPGCINRGIDEKTAIAIFDEIRDFANYGFNKSHAAAYAYVCYPTAYLKTFYPVEYMAALISSVDTADKITHYIANCMAMGIKRLPPDVNKSDNSFTVEGGGIRFGLSAIKNVGDGVIQNIVRERENGGQFKSFSDFIDRTAGKTDMNKRMLEQLINCGAFDSMGVKRSQLLAVYERVMDGSAASRGRNIEGQFSLFDDMEDNGAEMELPDIPELEKKQLLRLEKQATGMYFSGHPMEEYAARVKKITPLTIGDILSNVTLDEESGTYHVTGRLSDDDRVTICASIASRKNKTTRSNTQMAYLSIEDTTGAMECIIFPKVLSEYSPVLIEDAIVAICGRLSFQEDEPPKIKAETIEPVQTALAAHKEPERLYIKLGTKNEDSLKRVTESLAPYQGSMEVRLFFADTRKMTAVPRRYWFNNTASSLADLKDIFGADNVIIK